MQQKGQLSFDIYFAIMFAIIIAQQTFTISDQFSETANATGIIAQERQIINGVAAMVTSSQALSDSDDFSIEYQVPAIIDMEKRGPQTCDIEIAAGNGVITAYYPENVAGALTVQTSGPEDGWNGKVKILVDGTDTTGNFKCGDKITIVKT